jgi:hypothetical protein
MKLNANKNRFAGWLSALSMILTAAALSAVSTAPVMGQTTTCSLATVKGSYGLVATGTDLGMGPSTAVGIVAINGAGAFLYSYTQNINGVVSSGSVPGSYTVSTNCAASVTFANGETFAAVIVSGGAEIDLMSTTPSLSQTAVAKRVQ